MIKPLSMFPFPAFLFLNAPEIQATSSQDVMRSLGDGFGKISPLSLILVGSGIIGVLGLLTLWEIFRSGAKQREKIDIGWQYFTELGQQKGLTPPEMDLLKKIVEVGEISSADMVFDSSFIYEDSLEAFLKTLGGKHDKDGAIYHSLRRLRGKLGYTRIPAEIPLSSTRQIEEGTLVAVVREGGGQPLKGKVGEVDERSWFIRFEDTDVVSRMRAGELLRISILRSADGEYTTDVAISGLRQSTHTIWLNHTRSLERKQMRNWVRIDVNIPCRVTLVKQTGIPDANASEGLIPGQILEGRLVDLSGGGTCARFSLAIPQGYKLDMNFDLPGTSLRGIKAEVMRLSQVQKNGKEFFEHNLKFMTIETSIQEKIVRYVFEKQRIDSQLRDQDRIA